MNLRKYRKSQGFNLLTRGKRNEYANRQLFAANGTPINWYFQDYTTYQAFEKLFSIEQIAGINLIYQP